MNEKRSLWMIRLLSLAIAVSLWFFLSWDKRERQSERVVEASVTYDTANEMVVMNPVRQIEVRVRGGSRRVRTLNPSLVNVLVELPQTEPGSVPVPLAPEQVFVPEGVEVVSLNPSSLDLTLDREITKRLPVLVDLVGEPAAGATVGEPVANPPQVQVRGPKSRLEAVSVLKTRPVNLNGHAQTFRELASVLPPDPLSSLDPGLVEVQIPMQPPQLSTEALTGPRGER